MKKIRDRLEILKNKHEQLHKEIDMIEKELRPKCVLKNAQLKEVATTTETGTQIVFYPDQNIFT